MDETKALTIVSALAEGINPHTGEEFPPDSPYQTADIVRALLVAGRVLEARAKARSRTRLPSNAGKRWTPEEDQKLLTQFDAGGSVADLAQALGRTPVGIQARLEKHGRLQGTADGESGEGGRSWRSFAQRGEVDRSE